MYNKLQELRARRADGESGFTLIELLVVVVIIGILVAIAIPLYLNYKDGAVKRSVQSDIRNSVPLIEQAYADSNNTYPADDTAFHALSGLHISDGNSLTYTEVGTTGYTVQGQHGTDDTFCYQSATGKMASGACP